MDKKYLGDGVYASFNGFHVVLETPGETPIYLEDTVAVELINYIKEAFELKEN